MRTKSEIISLLTDPGVIAVMRPPKAELVLPIAGALMAGGVLAIEVTLTIPNALTALRDACEHVGGRGLVGAGTVLDASSCRAALEAGAEFIVCPIVRPELVAICHAADRPVMLGAYTPTEAQLAHEAGADFVKIFPSDGLGPGYIKALRAPLPHLKIIPTGIATPALVPEFIKAGCVGVGLGSLLMTPAVLKDENWHELTHLARQFVTMVRQAKNEPPRKA
jgi:2-dehydro-3-deoxyphosphogluconate aldolase/(4S)-4-hydroxy-2-oxoglutarate aldolase